jgi:hypothetical protein
MCGTQRDRTQIGELLREGQSTHLIFLVSHESRRLCASFISRVASYVSYFGYSSPSWLSTFQKDAAIVRLLRDAGAYPSVKTNVPITLLSFKPSFDVWGRATNPYSTRPSSPPVGLQVTKPHSLRLAAPDWASGQMWRALFVSQFITAAYILSKHLDNAFRRVGITLPSPDKKEGIPAAYSPMTRTLDDLETFWRAIVGMKTLGI